MPDGFVLDLGRCTGCAACGLACTIENDLEPGTSWRQVVTFNEPHHPSLPVHHLSLACNHCGEAPCMRACPALAYRRDDGTGAVLLDEARCIGCGYCAWACPYDAPRYDRSAGVMTKCTFCHPRLVDGGVPACVFACPTDALRFGDLDAHDGSQNVQGFPRTGAEPRIRFLLPNGDGSGRATSGEPGLEPGGPAACSRPPTRKIGLSTEWPLALFTSVSAWLVAWMVAARVGAVPVPALPFLAAALVGMLLSATHLGRPLRAWRAVWNLRDSWLSREVALYGLFVGTSAAYLLGAATPTLGWLAVGSGLACLYAMDRVYDVVARPGPFRMHSADVVMTGLFLASVLSGNPLAFGIFGGVRLALYIARKHRLRRTGRTWRPWTSMGRIVSGILLPAAAWRLGAPHVWILGAVAVGEILDRCEYYVELEVSTPLRQTGLDLHAALRGPATR